MASAQSTCSVRGCLKPEGTKLVKGMCQNHYGQAWRKAKNPRPTVECDVCGTAFTQPTSRVLRCSAECSAEGRKRGAAENALRYRDRKNAHMREYALARKAEKTAYDREYYRLNKERRAALGRAHYLANLAKYREYSALHRDAQLKRNAERRKAKPHEARDQRHRRRAAMYGVNSFRVSDAELRRALNRANGICQYCRTSKGEHWDHRVPLIRGGAHSIGNMVLACGFCNHQKHAKTVAEWRLWRRRAGLDDLAMLR